MYNLPGAPSAKIFGTYDVTSDFVYTPHFSFKFRIDKTYKGFFLCALQSAQCLLQKPNSNTLLTTFDPTEILSVPSLTHPMSVANATLLGSTFYIDSKHRLVA
jgi:hypothetical protein